MQQLLKRCNSADGQFVVLSPGEFHNSHYVKRTFEEKAILVFLLHLIFLINIGALYWQKS